MITITLTDQDIIRLQAVEMDRNQEEALAFVLERIVPELRRQQRGKMQSHLDGGKATM